MRRALAAAVIAAVVLAGGGEEDPGSGPAADDTAASSPTTSETGDATEEPSETRPTDDEPSEEPEDDAIAIHVQGDQIHPNGERIEVGTGETITLEVRSDRAGAFHVHSSPEQELEFGRGRSTLQVTVDTPGIVDVEEHEAGVVVLQLEVS